MEAVAEVTTIEIEAKVEPTPDVDLGDLLTAPGGPIHIDENLRGMLAYFSCGTALVQTGKMMNPSVDTFVNRRKRHGENIRVKSVDLRVIRNIYERSRTNSDDHSRQIELARRIFCMAARMNASDIHIITSRDNESRVYFRIHGLLVEMNELVFTFEHGTLLVGAICRSMGESASDPTYDPARSFGARIQKREFLPEQVDGIRISSIGIPGGNSTVLRLLYNTAILEVDFASLGYTEEQIHQLVTMMRRQEGCNLLSGPTGSGKSTTLLGVMKKLIHDAKGTKNVMTVEDPPEYRIPGARQTSVDNTTTDADRNRAFANAIRHALRHDPDVLMIGEMRDTASASLTFEASKTGHQTWSTVHANTALSIPGRIRDLDIHASDIYDPNVLTGLVCQRLVPVLCPHCRIELLKGIDAYSKYDADRIISIVGERASEMFTRGPGCEHCFNGINGRTVVAEVVIPDEQLFEFIRTENRIAAANYSLDDLNNITMQHHAMQKAMNGLVDPFMAENILGLFKPEHRRGYD